MKMLEAMLLCSLAPGLAVMLGAFFE